MLMTAIMVAGRSGSAFAAQLGTMKLTEEIDAMRTIGVSPMEALVLPRTIAAVLLIGLPVTAAATVVSGRVPVDVWARLFDALQKIRANLAAREDENGSTGTDGR